MIFSKVLLLLAIASVFSFSPTRLFAPIKKRSSMKCRMSSVPNLMSHGLLLAEQKINIEPYEAEGVPPIFLILSLSLVGVFASIPIISRKNQLSKNSRSIDDVATFDEAFEEKLMDRDRLNESFENGKGSVSRYTKD